MEDKVEKLTVAQFRKQIKMALDFCVQGGSIEIDRMGQKFLLMAAPRDSKMVWASGSKVAREIAEAPGTKVISKPVPPKDDGWNLDDDDVEDKVPDGPLCEHGKLNNDCLVIWCPFNSNNK